MADSNPGNDVAAKPKPAPKKKAPRKADESRNTFGRIKRVTR